MAGYGGPAAVGALIEFRTSLGWPGRWVSEPEALAVARYRDPAEFRAGLLGHAEAGMLQIAPSGAFQATARGHEFLAALAADQARGLARWWADAPVEQANPALAALLAAAAPTGGPAWHAMAPAYEQPTASAAQLLLDRLGTLRYHRADAHARAWRSVGLTAAEMVALPPGPQRAAIEADTNWRAAAPYRMLDAGPRTDLLATLARFPG